MSTSKSVSMGDSGGGGGWQKKKKKYDVTKDALALAPVAWDPRTRPKPNFVTGIWEDEEIEDLSRYVDWHRTHPHCTTPRPIKEDEDFRTGDKKIDEGNPKLLYSKMPGQPPPLPKEYLPPPLGAECDIDTVSVIAMEKEYNTIVYNKFVAEDPWYMMSVKDQLEQSHIDGSHTTVKSKKSSASTVMSAFNKEAAWQLENYGDYEGGYPNVKASHYDRLAELSLADKRNLQHTEAAAKVGPWDTHRDFTQYTKHGTALKDYEVLALERNIQAALAEHERELREEEEAMRASASRKSSRKSKKSKRVKPGQVVPEEAGVDSFDRMRKRLGTHKEIEKMTRGFVRLAKKVASHSKLEKNALETKMDLVEACNKLRVVKVNAMLLLPGTDANMKTPEDEPIFLHMFSKAVRMDQISGHCRLGSEDQDTADRKRIAQVLSALLGRCDVDIIGREGITAAHMAAMGDSSKLMQLLAEHKANFELLSTHDEGGMTPLMMAAKYGHVYCCADLIRHKVDINRTNRVGMTALHYAGMFGQTRTAKFLLRVGADKFIKDHEGRTAGRLAMDYNFMATGQAISAFARLKRDVASQLEYLVEQDEKNRNKRQGLLGALSRTKSFFNSLTMANLGSGVTAVAKFVYKHLRRYFLYWLKELCDYLEVDYEPPQEREDGAEGDDEDSEDDDDELAEGEQKQGDIESGLEGNTDNSEGTASRRGTALSVKEGVGASADGPAGFANVDGFASVPPGGKADNGVIGFHEEF